MMIQANDCQMESLECNIGGVNSINCLSHMTTYTFGSTNGQLLTTFQFKKIKPMMIQANDCQMESLECNIGGVNSINCLSHMTTYTFGSTNGQLLTTFQFKKKEVKPMMIQANDCQMESLECNIGGVNSINCLSHMTTYTFGSTNGQLLTTFQFKKKEVKPMMIQANDCQMESLECNIGGVNSINCLSHMTTYTFGSTNGQPLTTFQLKKIKPMMIQANDCQMESLECNIGGVNSINCLSHMTTYTFGSTNGQLLTTFQFKKKEVKPMMIQANDCQMESLECNIGGVNSINCLSHMTTYTFGSTNGQPLTTFQFKNNKK